MYLYRDDLTTLAQLTAVTKINRSVLVRHLIRSYGAGVLKVPGLPEITAPCAVAP